MSFMEIMKVKDNLVLTGKFYKTMKDSANIFSYEEVDTRSRSYSTIMNNLIADETTYVIKTNTEAHYNIRGFISTQEDKLYQITRVERHQTSENKDVLRIVKANPNTYYVIGLVEIDNPMEIK